MQWLDAGSTDLLFHLGRRLAGEPILLLGAYRPEEGALQRADTHHSLADVIGELQATFSELRLDLTQASGPDLVDALLDSEPNRLSREFRLRLFQHTSGNPLFTLELLRGMQLRGDLQRDGQGRWVAGSRLDWQQLPARVEAVIARRADYLSPLCRRVLRAASVQGEQFSPEVVAALLQEDPLLISSSISREACRQHRLVEAHGVQPVDGQGLAQYRFRHSLFQVFFYGQLDAVEKARLHGGVARQLEAIYQQRLTQPADLPHTLARHFAAAGDSARAVGHYAAAGRHALSLAAPHEALAHIRSALRLLQALPPSDERDAQELDLQLSLGTALTAGIGWGAPEITTAYARAGELCARNPDHARLVPALWQLAVYHLGRSEHDICAALVGRLRRLAQQIDEPALQHLVRFEASSFYRGTFAAACQSLLRVTADADVDLERRLIERFGMSPAVLGGGYLAEALWIMGHTAASAQQNQASRALAARLGHPLIRCYALMRSAWWSAMQRDLAAVSSYAGQVDELAAQHGFPSFRLAAQFFSHLATLLHGQGCARDLDQLERASTAYLDAGTVLNRTGFLTYLALACLQIGQHARGLTAAEDALALGRRTGELWSQAETWRVQGDLLLAREAGAGAAAAAAYHSALQTAAEQGAAMFALRAALSLHRLAQDDAAQRESRARLAAWLQQLPEAG